MTTRPPHPDHELLSAYFDGEVTPEERARAEVLKHTSPEAAAELESYAELSHLLKSLPRAAAPPEVRAAALLAVERWTLLPRCDRPSRRWRFVREAIIFCAGCAVALLISFAVQISHPDAEPRNRGGVTSTVSPRPAMPAADLPVASVEPVSASRPGDFFDVSGSGRPHDSFAGKAVASPREGIDDAASEARTMSTMTTRMLPSNSATSVLAPPPSNVVANADDAAPRAELETSADVQQKAVVPVSDVVLNLFAATAVNDQYVPNVDVYFTDPEAAAQHFQQILVSNGIAMSDIADDARGSFPSGDREKAGAAVETEPLQPAVYLEAPIAPVTRSLEQLAQQPEMFGVRLRPPLELPLERRSADAAGSARIRRIDVERLKLEYNRNLELVLSDAREVDSTSVVSALDALREVRNGLLANELARREQQQRSVVRPSADRRDAAGSVPQAGRATLSAPVVPLELRPQPELANSQIRLNVPVSKPGARTPADQLLASGETNSATRSGLADEIKLRQRWPGGSGTSGQVRLLVVFQRAASAASSSAATIPAHPAAPVATPPQPPTPTGK